jgi:hypothetical protein
LPISVLALSAIVALTAGFVWTNRLVLAQYAAVAWLKETGVAPASLTIDDLTLDGATLKNIVLGAQRISRIEAAYTLSELRRGRIERVVFSNVQGRAQWRGGVLTLPGLTPPRPGGPGGGAARTVVIDGYRIVVDTDGGPVTIEGGRAEVVFADGDADIRADVTIAAAAGRIKGRLQATLFGGEMLGRFIVAEGDISAPWGSAKALHGVVQIIVGAQGPELDARLDIEGLELGGRKTPTARVAIAATGPPDAIAIDGQLTVPAGKVRLRGIVRRSLRGDIRFEGTSAASLAIDGVKAAVNGALRLARTPNGALSGELDIAATRLGYRGAGAGRRHGQGCLCGGRLGCASARCNARIQTSAGAGRRRAAGDAFCAAGRPGHRGARCGARAQRAADVRGARRPWQGARIQGQRQAFHRRPSCRPQEQGRGTRVCGFRSGRKSRQSVRSSGRSCRRADA